MTRPLSIWRLAEDIYSLLGIRYVLYVALLAVTGLTEGLSLATLVPLFGTMGIGSTGAGGRMARIASAALHWTGVPETLWSIGAIVIVALALSTALFLAQAYVGARLQTTYVYLWQQRLAADIFWAQWVFVLKRRHGDVVNVLVTETQRMGAAFYQAGLLLAGTIYTVVFLVVAATLSSMTAVFITAGGAALLVFSRPLVRRSYILGKGISEENASLQSLAGELIAGVKLVKATATEQDALSAVAGAANRLRRHILGNAFDVQAIRGLFEFGAAAMGAVILVASQTVLKTDPAVTLVVLAIFVRLMPKLTSVQHGLQSLSFLMPAVELVQAFARDAEAHRETQWDDALPPPLRHGPFGVQLDGVGVQYASVDALSAVSIDIPAGACVALVGGSGAGKSTLVDAVLGLVPLTSGVVRISGEPLDRLPLTSLRRRIGYMGQETVLYNGSIRDNLMWGHRDADAAALDRAAHAAGANRFISRMPNGYDTPVGDRGALLAGGERQRLGLARAALGDPGLLILDEATSALDAETERSVTDAISRLKGTTTVVMITHRLSSARIADAIYVMEGGRIVEGGSWDQLVESGGRFHQLWQLQNAGERVANVEA